MTKATKLPFPNNIFLEHLVKAEKEAKESGSHSHFAYRKAINSIKAHPQKLENGKDCQKLDGIGARIADQLDKVLEEYNRRLSGEDGKTKKFN